MGSGKQGEEWVEYFKKTLGGVVGRVVREMRGVRMDDEEEEITREEVRGAVRKAKEGKAAGGDEIPGRHGNMEGRGWRVTYGKFARGYGKGKSGLMSGMKE